MATIRASLAALLLTIALIPAAAQAQDRPERWVFDADDKHGLDLSVVGIFGRTLGGGVILGIPVGPRGFSPEINDSFHIEIEGGVGAWTWGWSGRAYFLAGVRYQLHLFEWMSPYLAGRAGLWIPLVPGTGPTFTGYGAIGVMFKPSEHFAIRIEGGYGGRAGVTFLF
jgi:hypothetical protein